MHRIFSAGWILTVLIATVPASAQSFVLKTDPSGLGATPSLNGIAVADYDNDGDLDIYAVNWNQHDPDDSKTWNKLFRNNGNGTFTDVTAAAGVRAESITGYSERPGMGNRFGAAWGDYDADGDPDLLLTNVGPEILYRNNGDGTFTDVTDEAGVAGDPDDEYESSSPAWWDYDGDGDLDLHISTWNLGPNRMYENNGDGTFTDVSEASGLRDAGSTWSAAPIDVNRDGLLDLYAVNDFAANTIFVNQGDGTFADETAERSLGDTGHGMGVTVEDFNNDGHADIYLTNIFFEGVESNPLYANDGTGRFDNLATQFGVDNADWAWGTEFFDCDHDGDLDLYVANGYIGQPPFHNRMFVNQLEETGTAAFIDVAQTAGVNGRAEARGMVSFDFDNDGDLDVLIANAGLGDGVVETEAAYLYENTTARKNWIKINLVGTRTNRDGVGAEIRLTADGKTYDRHNDGVGFLGQSIRPIHFGLGAATYIDEIQVHWVGGAVERYLDFEPNQTIKLVEGQGVATALELESPRPPRPDRLAIESYPNPVGDWVSFRIAGEINEPLMLSIVDVTGHTVASHRLEPTRAGNPEFRLDLKNLPPGAYFYRVDGAPGQLIVKAR